MQKLLALSKTDFMNLDNIQHIYVIEDDEVYLDHIRIIYNGQLMCIPRHHEQYEIVKDYLQKEYKKQRCNLFDILEVVVPVLFGASMFCLLAFTE